MSNYEQNGKPKEDTGYSHKLRKEISLVIG